MHTPVLYHETISLIQPRNGGLYVDCTVGAGGHAWGILDASRPDGCLLGMDVDMEALTNASDHLAEFGERVILELVSYTNLENCLNAHAWSAVDGILIDLGVSSMQLDTPERGFSFRSDAPLDMRFGQNASQNAADLVNGLSETELGNLLYQYGEEPQARKIARAIIKTRPIKTTGQLADLITKTISTKKRGINPATKTFQALRIAVNHEMEAIDLVLPQAIKALRRGGRLIVISYHSLEDRKVKRYFVRENRDCICEPSIPKCVCGHLATIRMITSKPVRPTETEVSQNLRARSAKLRAVEKI